MVRITKIIVYLQAATFLCHCFAPEVTYPLLYIIQSAAGDGECFCGRQQGRPIFHALIDTRDGQIAVLIDYEKAIYLVDSGCYMLK